MKAEKRSRHKTIGKTYILFRQVKKVLQKIYHSNICMSFNFYGITAIQRIRMFIYLSVVHIYNPFLSQVNIYTSFITF